MLTVTRRSFDFTKSPKYYFDDNQLVTHMLNALSGMFPDGEQFFVDSVRHFRTRLDRNDPFQKEISGFIGQEAMHSLAHDQFNKYCSEYNIPVDKVQRGLEIALNVVKKRFPMKFQLATTVCLEHYTAIMAAKILTDADFRSRLEGSMKDMWLWHAGEEVAHAHVAWDLYHDPRVGGTFEERVATMALVTPIFALAVAANIAYLCSKDGWRLADVPKGLWSLFGYKGFYSSLGKVYLDFFKRDFHPNHHTVEVLGEQPANLRRQAA